MCAGLGALLLAGATARAESFRLDRFSSGERPDDAFGVRRLGAFDHLRFGANAVIDYANDPLVIKESRNSNADSESIVDHQLTLKLDFSLTLWDRLMLLAGFDAPLMMKGPDAPGFNVPPADGAGFGDVSLGGRLRILGDADDVFGLGMQAVVILPTAGNSQSYSGEENVAVRPEVIADIRAKVVRIGATVGVLAHKKITYVDREIGSELLYGVVLGVPITERFELLGELRGGFDFEHFGSRTSTGVEWLAGAKGNTRSGWWFGAGIGSGLTRGIGTPDLRVVGQVGYLTPLKEKKKEEEKPPVGDRDQDGILDDVDACPDKAEDRDGFGDEDGCPDPDNDGDGVLDTEDACANEAEDRDGFSDADGCPDPDNDGDAVLDVEDKCPDEPGPPETQGCAAKPTTETEATELFALEKVQFENDKDTILPESYPLLERVKQSLDEHPEIETLRVEGHTDGMGSPPYNMRLSRGRTASVVRWLRDHGVTKDRLEAWGCGELYLIADDATEEGRATNRRVEFKVVKPAAPGADVAPRKGCTKVPVP